MTPTELAWATGFFAMVVVRHVMGKVTQAEAYAAIERARAAAETARRAA